MALALQDHRLIGHNRYVQFFSEEAWRHCGRAGEGLPQARAWARTWGRPSQLSVARSTHQGMGHHP